MNGGKRKTPRPNLNKCGLCKCKADPLFRMPGMEMKGTFCEKCVKEVEMRFRLGRVCVHGCLKSKCAKKECVIRYVMEA